MCVEEVRSALSKTPSIEALQLQLKPPVARFKIDADKVTLQDLVSGIRGAGAAFDGKLLLEEDPKLSDTRLDQIDKALTAVPGIKNTGWPDDLGRRVITFDLKQHTLFGDILKAGNAIGIELKTPEPDAK